MYTSAIHKVKNYTYMSKNRRDYKFSQRILVCCVSAEKGRAVGHGSEGHFTASLYTSLVFIYLFIIHLALFHRGGLPLAPHRNRFPLLFSPNQPQHKADQRSVLFLHWIDMSSEADPGSVIQRHGSRLEARAQFSCYAGFVFVSRTSAVLLTNYV